MQNMQFHIVKPDEKETFELIATWYLEEWKIPVEKTLGKLEEVTSSKTQFQVLTNIENRPVSTGGVYHHVGLLDRVPQFRIYQNWLALVHTIKEERGKGYGAVLCNFIQNHAFSLGIDTLHLYTDTAEKLYSRLGWIVLERVKIENRNLVVMEKKYEGKTSG